MAVKRMMLRALQSWNWSAPTTQGRESLPPGGHAIGDLRDLRGALRKSPDIRSAANETADWCLRHGLAEAALVALMDEMRLLKAVAAFARVGFTIVEARVAFDADDDESPQSIVDTIIEHASDGLALPRFVHRSALHRFPEIRHIHGSVVVKEVYVVPISGRHLQHGACILINPRKSSPEWQSQAEHATEALASTIRLHRANAESFGLSEVCRILGENMAAADAADSVLRKIIDNLPVAAAVLRVTDINGNLEVVSKQGDSEIEWDRWRKHSSVAETVYTERQTSIVDVSPSNRQFFTNYEWLDDNNIRRVAAFPLIDGDHVRGTLSLCCRYRHPFDTRAQILLANLTRGLVLRFHDRQQSMREAARYHLVVHNTHNDLLVLHSRLVAAEKYLTNQITKLHTEIPVLVHSAGKLVDTTRSFGDRVSETNDLLSLLKHRLGKPLVRKKQIAFEIEVPKGISIDADPRDLLLILQSVLQNASQAIAECSHNDGRITITAVAADSQLIISIKDNGVGITKEAMTKILKEEVSQWVLRRGSGTGLLRAQQLAETYGATMQITSRRGEYTRVDIMVPRGRYSVIGDSY